MSRSLTRAQRSAAKNLIIYSKRTGECRRVIDADDDSEYDWYLSRLHPGEGYFFLSHSIYDALSSPHELNHLVAVKAGFTQAPDPFDIVHHVIGRNGEVVMTIHADPSCGDDGEHISPGYKLIRMREFNEL